MEKEEEWKAYDIINLKNHHLWKPASRKGEFSDTYKSHSRTAIPLYSGLLVTRVYFLFSWSQFSSLCSIRKKNTRYVTGRAARIRWTMLARRVETRGRVHANNADTIFTPANLFRKYGQPVRRSEILFAEYPLRYYRLLNNQFGKSINKFGRRVYSERKMENLYAMVLKTYAYLPTYRI